MLNFKKITTGTIMLFLILGLHYSYTNTKCYLFTSVPVYIELSLDEQLVYEQEFRDIDFPIPIYFECKKSSIIHLKIRRLDSKTETEFKTEIHLKTPKHLILTIKEHDSEIIVDDYYTFFRPMFQ